MFAVVAALKSFVLRLAVVALGAVVVPLITQSVLATTFPAHFVATSYNPQIQWSARMEGGNLSEWNGEDPSGSAVSTAVTAASQGITAHGGGWVMKQAVTGTGGTRMNVFPGLNVLCQAGTTFWASWWHYFPSAITFPVSDSYQIWQIASQSSDLVFSPIWVLSINQTSFSFSLVWSADNHAPSNGPHSGETGKRIYPSAVLIPTAQWVFFEIMVTPAGSTDTDFTGALKIIMNNQVLFDLTGIKTRFPDVAPGGLMYTTHNAYGSNLTPNPAVQYVDDVTYSLLRMPSGSLPITYRAGSSASAATPTVVVNKPAGVVNGDVLAATVQTNGTSPLPSGWTQRATANTPTGAAPTYLATKVASSEPASWTFCGSGGSYCAVVIDAYTGVDNITPMDVASTVSTGTGATVTFPNITTVTDKAWHYVSWGDDGAGVGSTPTGYSARTALAAGGMSGFDKSISPAGLVTGVTKTGGTSWVSFSAALRPAVP